MSVPITPPGNPDAKQQAPESNATSEDIGPGHIMGNLVADPELRFTPGGKPVTKLRVAFTPRIPVTETGGWIDGETEFYDVDVWGHQGERAVDTFKRGDRIVATGAWTKRNWTSPGGEAREAYSLTARDVGPSLLFKPATIDRTKHTEDTPSHG